MAAKIQPETLSIGSTDCSGWVLKKVTDNVGLDARVSLEDNVGLSLIGQGTPTLGTGRERPKLAAGFKGVPASGRNRGAQSSGGRRTAEGAEELLRLPGAQAPRPWSTLLPPGRLRAPPPNRWLSLRASVGTVRKHLPRPPRSYHLPPYPAAAHFPVNLVPGLQAVPDAPHPPQAIPLLPQFLPFQLLPKCSVRDICSAAVAPSGRNIFNTVMPQKETSEGWMKMASAFTVPQGPDAQSLWDKKEGESRDKKERVYWSSTLSWRWW
ncbi:uncharacterized protein LOC123581352 [Leopardus geoffroyi]|uniref:uncharacterized protein LOC123581352 n=1 Tax=Leopardus geoffroyi TaxID=46844 RepID=UPI001E263FA9|nr:uncharacterized protein LOC123581352 [Leopardus geoffroyi]